MAFRKAVLEPNRRNVTWALCSGFRKPLVLRNLAPSSKPLLRHVSYKNRPVPQKKSLGTRRPLLLEKILVDRSTSFAVPNALFISIFKWKYLPASGPLWQKYYSPYSSTNKLFPCQIHNYLLKQFFCRKTTI